MKKRISVVVLAVVGVLALILGTTAALANGPTAPSNNPWPQEDYCPGPHEEMAGWGMHGFHMMGLTDPVTLERVAGTVGLTYDQLVARLEQGETLAQIAQARGVISSTVVEAILASQVEVLSVLVKYGYLSDTEADSILEQARLRVEQAITVAYGFHGPYSPATGPEESCGPGYAPDYENSPMMGNGHMGMRR